MDNTFSQFLAAYSTATPEMKRLIDSEEIGLFVDTLLIGETTANIKPKLLVIITNRLLSVIDDFKAGSQIYALNLKDQTSLVKIKTFLDSKLTPKQPQTFDPAVVTAEIAETEAALAGIPSLRTMVKDGQQIGYASAQADDVYTSHQSAILNEGK